MSPLEVVHRYFKAMQAGPADAEALFALFAEDAVYVEPFSGTEQTHEGRVAIEGYLRASWETGPPDVKLEVNRTDVEGDVVRTEWTCESPAFEQPIKGLDVCTVSGGRIARLEVKFR